MNAKQLKKIHIWIRAIIQLLYFIFIPSVYTAAFAGSEIYYLHRLVQVKKWR